MTNFLPFLVLFSFSAFATFDGAHWMEKRESSLSIKKLLEIKLPGSHNSGTSAITHKSDACKNEVHPGCPTPQQSWQIFPKPKT